MLNDSRLLAPPEDGGVLVEPRGAEPLRLLESNRRGADGWRWTCCGVDVARLRRQARQALNLVEEHPVVATGHQPDLAHAGVWAKGVVCAELAKRAAGQAVYVVVDHDQVRERFLRLPRAVDGRVQVESIALPGFEKASVYEQLASWGTQDVDHLEQAVSAAAGPLRPAGPLQVLFAALREIGPRSGWAGQWTAALARVDEGLGVRARRVLASELDLGCFFAEIIGQARRFAGCYNAALAAYRASHGIKGTGRPIPDLSCDAQRVELPVWVLPHGEAARRERLFVVEAGERLTLLAATVPLVTCRRSDFQNWRSAAPVLAGAEANFVLRPRALALTMWIRLVLCDLFVHGIGGARYDQITDRIISDYFGVQPPGMIVVSGTLRLPLPNSGLSRSALAAARGQLRNLTWNPDRCPCGATGGPLLPEKRRLIERSARLRREHPADHASRRQVFSRIREINAALGRLCVDQQARLALGLTELADQLRSNEAAASREYFYALHPESRLQGLRSGLLAELA